MLIDELRRKLDPTAVITDPHRLAPYMQERRGLYPGKGQVVVRPANVRDITQAIEICHRHGASIVPQAGNTGTVGGGSPRSATEVVLSVERLEAIREIDPDDGTITVESGCTLASIQRAAYSAGRLFPLSLPSQEQCRVGGNLATNAGGLNVLRYGTTRELTLGIEVVLADGRIWSNLTGLRKDNSAYDLKDLFIGSEGTLGVITAAKLRLFPLPRCRRVTLLSLPSVDAALPLLRQLQAESGDAVVAAELISSTAMAMGQLLEGTPANPLAEADWYLLLELASPDPRADLDTCLSSILEPAMNDGSVSDAAISSSESSAERLWLLRTAIPDGQKHAGASIKHDISVRPGELSKFLPKALAAITEYDKDIRPCVFGHVGDGNLHFNLTQPAQGSADDFLARRAEINRIVHDIVAKHHGSIAAEHGVGQLRLSELSRCADPLSLELMGRIKDALDPNGIFNRGKKIPWTRFAQ
ncbi:FAD-binding oxidoreductase [Halorhodospira halochloris]|nr:FAD-binding oxidoreductase [Halorhodospira halochloris]MBK1651034.1 hydroxyacid dehydrogenase [Halorhodospira halochloris]